MSQKKSKFCSPYLETLPLLMDATLVWWCTKLTTEPWINRYFSWTYNLMSTAQVLDKMYVQKWRREWNRTHDLPVCSVVPQPLHHRTPQIFFNTIINSSLGLHTVLFPSGFPTKTMHAVGPYNTGFPHSASHRWRFAARTSPRHQTIYDVTFPLLLPFKITIVSLNGTA
jgi:hypothetical protein